MVSSIMAAEYQQATAAAGRNRAIRLSVKCPKASWFQMHLHVMLRCAAHSRTLCVQSRPPKCTSQPVHYQEKLRTCSIHHHNSHQQYALRLAAAAHQAGRMDCPFNSSLAPAPDTMSPLLALSALTARALLTLAWVMTSSMSLASTPDSSTSSPSSSSTAGSGNARQQGVSFQACAGVFHVGRLGHVVLGSFGPCHWKMFISAFELW